MLLAGLSFQGSQTIVQIENRPIEALIPYARNSRTHSDAQVAQIAASIREFGWTNPVLVDGSNGIIAGHGRVLAARKLGLTQPTLSRQVAAIEQRLGVTLFERAGKSMVLTATGLDLLEHVRTMGSAADALGMAATGRSQAVEGIVSVSASDMVATYLLPRLVRH